MKIAKSLIVATGWIAIVIGVFLTATGVNGGVRSLSFSIDSFGWRIAFSTIGLILAALGSLIIVHAKTQKRHSADTDLREASARDDEGRAKKSLFRISPSLFVLPLVFAAFFEVVVLPRMSGDSTYKRVVDHVTVAILTASILGLTYEYFLSKKREKGIRRLIKKLGRGIHSDLDDLFRVYAATTPEIVLRLFRDIAAQTKQIPTLYRPPRNGDNEYTFAANLEYFDLLVNLRRKQFCEVIAGWLRDPSSPPNVRFLASDFIGRYRLRELTELLQGEITVQRSQWGNIDERDKCWVLNYMWACSRCDSPMYRSLTEFLCSDADEWAQKWILFVPLQMPDQGLGDMIFAYLQSSRQISESNLNNALKALSLLDTKRACDARSIIDRNQQRFETPALRAEVKRLFGLELKEPSGTKPGSPVDAVSRTDPERAA